MLLHQTLVEELITLIEVNSGWSEQRKLREALAKFKFAVYTQKNGTGVLVSESSLAKATKDATERK